MARPVDIACFSARYLALLRRFPNQLQANACLVMPAPEAPGVLVFAASHNHHYLLFYDREGFSEGVYEFGLPEEFFSAIGPRHMSHQPEKESLRLALSNGEYCLYDGTGNDRIFDPGAADQIVFTWSGWIGRAQESLREAMDAVLFLHQEGKWVSIEQALSPHYAAEVDFIRAQLEPRPPVVAGHRWLRLPDDSVRCLTHFATTGRSAQHVHALICVDADMALG